MPSLYELDKAYLQALESAMEIDEETGEVTINESALEAMEMEYGAKIDNIVCYVKNIEALNDAIKKEEEALKRRRQVNANKVERLKRYIGCSLNSRGYDKYETAKNKLSFRKSESVVITNQALIDPIYLKMKTEISVDKTALKQDLKGGMEIEGCYLETKHNLQVR